MTNVETVHSIFLINRRMMSFPTWVKEQELSS